MASRIITKKGSGAPLASDLVHGELAVDTVNKRLYTENAGGTVIEVGTSPSTIDINAGTIDGTVIGGSSAAAGSFTTGQFNTSLNVDGTVTAGDLILDDGTNARLTFTGDTSAAKIFATTTGFANYEDLELHADNYLFKTGATERMRIGSSGNVGIGTSSPAQKAHIYESTAATGAFLQTQEVGGQNAYFGVNTAGGSIQVTGANPLQIATNGSERMRIDSSGNVGINATTVAANGLQIGNTSSTDTEQLYLYTNKALFSVSCDGGTNAAGTTLSYSWANGGQGPLKFNNASGEVARFDSSGNLLVGTTVSTGAGRITAASDSGGSAYPVYAHNTNTGSTEQIVIDIGRNGTRTGSISNTDTATSYTTSSDYRLKENITDAPAGNIDDIKVRSFDWKANGSHQDYGMVAQELEAVAPYAVTKGATEDDMWSVDYSKLVPMLIKEIQDLKAEVAALKGA